MEILIILIGITCIVIQICLIVRFFKVTSMMMRHMAREKKYQEAVLTVISEIKETAGEISESVVVDAVQENC